MVWLCRLFFAEISMYFGASFFKPFDFNLFYDGKNINYWHVISRADYF